MSLSGADVFLFRLGNSRDLRQWLLVRCEFRHKMFDTVLELTIFGGVDQRVNAGVCDHQYHGEVVEPAFKVDRVADGIEKEDDLAGGPANDVSKAHHQRRDCSIASSRV